MYKKKAVITGTHGGLECGVFCDKMKGLDVISFGPDIYNAHTPDEKADINSINRVWEFLIKALERL
jgi:dipeptidase D